METTTAGTSRTTPKDFFLWAGALIALYASITSLIALLFEYINYLFPDPLAYAGDPYSGSMRFAMATLIVFVPAMVILLRLIRGTISREAGKAGIWVRRWAIGLTLFIAGVAILIDLVTLVNTFLGGEITVRFALKVAVVLLVAIGVFLHFLADFKGYWIANAKKANLIGIAVGVLALVAVVSGFFIVGTPTDQRAYRYDDQRVSDLETIQYEVLNHYQQKGTLPKATSELNDELDGFLVPVDPENGMDYRYEAVAPLSFKLCATFSKATQDLEGRGAYAGGKGYDMASRPRGYGSDTWTHGVGETCFDRTIDPDEYPIYEKSDR